MIPMDLFSLILSRSCNIFFLTVLIDLGMLEKLDPLGVAVVIEAEHLCMRMRGVQKQNSIVITSTLLGAFQNRQETRSEFMNLIRQKY